MNKIAVAQELVKIAKSLTAIGFPAQDAYDKYWNTYAEYRRAISEFIKYFMLFYGRDGLTPIAGLTEADIRKGVDIRMKKYPNTPWDGDSTDRELVRDIVLGWRPHIDRNPKRAAKSLTAEPRHYRKMVNNLYVRMMDESPELKQDRDFIRVINEFIDWAMRTDHQVEERLRGYPLQ